MNIQSATFHHPIPKGLRNKAQGCEARATLGKVAGVSQPQRGCVTFLWSTLPTTGYQRAAGKVLKTLRNPVGVDAIFRTIPRVAPIRSGQPWALLRNPFGIRVFVS